MSIFKLIPRIAMTALLALALVGVSACNSEKRITKANVDEVAEGMSKKQVESILGLPTSIDNKDFIVMKKTTYVYRQERAGKTHIRVCRTLGCAMAGSYQVMENLCAAAGISRKIDKEETHNPVSVSADGKYSIEFVECLATCGTAPVCMVNETLHE